ncbi:MAG: putative PEP-binding protein, partial [Fervidobacterium sp.]
LTQMTFGFSRDDVGKFLPEYLAKGILEEDPFKHVDTEGVGQLVKFATEKGKEVKEKLKCGVCGEHGGDPKSIMFFAQTKLDYVSASPYRIPVARLAAAQASIKYRS